MKITATEPVLSEAEWQKLYGQLKVGQEIRGTMFGYHVIFEVVSLDKGHLPAITVKHVERKNVPLASSNPSLPNTS